MQDSEVAYIRSYFYSGGEYAPDGHGGHYFRDQMYVEKLVPVDGVRQTRPVVLMHGNTMTGTNFLNKPDGGRGWASDFIAQGYEIYIIDQPYRGRSAFHRGDGAADQSTYSAELMQDRFTASHINKQWPQAAKHTQWPGTGLMGDTIFDAFYASTVQFVANETHEQLAMQKAGAALLDRIGRPVILVGHSQAGMYPPLMADVRPNLVAAMVLIEPKGPPFQETVFSKTASRKWGVTDAPMTYEPPVTDHGELIKVVSDGQNVQCILQAESPPPRKFANIAHIPILVVTAEASYHAQYDDCTVAYYRQAGCTVEHVELANIGIHGNGHMMLLEKNSHAIQVVLEAWIRRH